MRIKSHQTVEKLKTEKYIFEYIFKIFDFFQMMKTLIDKEPLRASNQLLELIRRSTPWRSRRKKVVSATLENLNRLMSASVSI